MLNLRIENLHPEKAEQTAPSINEIPENKAKAPLDIPELVINSSEFFSSPFTYIWVG